MSDRYNSKIADWIGRLNKCDRYAVTISSTCTLFSVPEDQVGIQWRKHEDKHKAQIAHLGWWGFMATYFWHTALYGYNQNDMEVDARAAALQ